ncbi:MAG: glycoside hydrolase family 15 protein [Limnochordia bacterium]|nr:glycoside hydrolase family 15 protein [Limnochordia bacterium]
MNLRQKSIEMIKKYQHQSGAYVASPNFPTYHYSWLRDGSFIAYGMDRVGEHESSLAFYRWVHETLLNHEEKARRALDQHRMGKSVGPKELLHTRYTLEGREGQEDWPNFQLDGYGTWLWGLATHIELTCNRQLLQELAGSIELTLEYIQEFWQWDNYDCWEEFGDKKHPSTLACLYGGLKAMERLLGRPELGQTAAQIRQYIIDAFVFEGRVHKFRDLASVDSNLLWLSLPFGVVEAEDPIMVKTVEEIERTLLFDGGGVHRYAQDTYYGGGLWLLLSAWLGWYYTQVGRYEDAKAIRTWIERQRNANDELPEQVPNHVNDPDYIQPWVKRWGEVACPLLWSHGMYLVLDEEIRRGEG